MPIRARPYVCRHCGKEYTVLTCTAEVPGYCTKRCQRAKARLLGFTKRLQYVPGMTEYDYLKKAGEVGYVEEV